MWIGLMLLGCGPGDGSGVGAEYRFDLESDARFDVLARSEVGRSDASGVSLGMFVQFEDGEREPFRVQVETEGETIELAPDREDESLYFPAEVDLFPCADGCETDVVFTVIPDFDGPRAVFVSIDLIASGTDGAYPAWEYLDLGVEAPPEAY